MLRKLNSRGTAAETTAFQCAQGKKILIVEYGFSGQKSRNSLDDSIEIINKQNHHDPYECTNKGFGGTSATWGGRCVMYDEIDFICFHFSSKFFSNNQLATKII